MNPSTRHGWGDVMDSSADHGRIAHRTARRTVRWFSWIFGFAMLAAVIIAALHFSEERELVRIAERAQPWWLGIAIILQAGTYLAQGETWRVMFLNQLGALLLNQGFVLFPILGVGAFFLECW